jgi:antitoxin (DNA-binding transcriptional repressor) of toxin-antitoxin stability system
MEWIMRSTRIEVGSYEAKTKLPALLRGIQNGMEYVITNRGVAIANLIPAQERRSQGAADAVKK